MHRESTDVSQLFREGGKIAITSRHPQTNEVYLALFNINDDKEEKISVNLKDLGLNGDCKVTDMWTGEEMGTVSNDFTQVLKPHASGLYKFN